MFYDQVMDSRAITWLHFCWSAWPCPGMITNWHMSSMSYNSQYMISLEMLWLQQTTCTFSIEVWMHFRNLKNSYIILLLLVTLAWKCCLSGITTSLEASLILTIHWRPISRPIFCRNPLNNDFGNWGYRYIVKWPEITLMSSMIRMDSTNMPNIQTMVALQQKYRYTIPSCSLYNINSTLWILWHKSSNLFTGNK